MQIIDLSKIYLQEYFSGRNRIKYENSFPELIRHYYEFWTDRDRDLISIGGDEITIRMGWIDNFIAELGIILRKNNIDPDIINYIYFIGVGTTNGHAFRHKVFYHVWFPIETYTNERLVRVFITHEVAHALHYHFSQAFYFPTIDDKQHIGRQLITEGLATYFTKVILNISDIEALWADYLTAEEGLRWWLTCEESQTELYQLIEGNFDRCDHKLEIFYANDPSNIFQFRAGYYAGLKLIERYARKNHLSILALLKLPREIFEKEIFAFL
jgi:hypothetical protein